MGKVAIRFGEKSFSQICTENSKFKDDWDLMLAWIKMVDQKDWADLKYFAGTKYSQGSPGDRSKTILEKVLDAIAADGRRVNGDILFHQCFPKVVDCDTDEKIKKIGKELPVIVKVIQNYLPYLELQNPRERLKLLFLSLKRKNNHEFFTAAMSEWKNLLDQEPLDLMQSHDQWLLMHLYYNHPNTQTTGDEVPSFLKKIQALETFNQLINLNYFLDALHLNVKLSSRDQLLIKRKVKPILKQRLGELPELIQLHVLAIKMTLSNDLAEYAKFKKLYQEHHSELEVAAHLNIIKSIFNVFYLIFSTNGDEKIAEQAFDWMRRAWELRLFDQQGSINDGDYMNFMILANFLKKMELFTEFQKEYEPLLDPGVVQLVKSFCEIRLLFEASKYNQALTLLNVHFPLRSNAIDPKYNIRVKALRVMIYLEMLLKGEALSIDNEQYFKGEKLEIDDLMNNGMGALRQYCSRMRKELMDEQILIGNQRFVSIVRLFGEYIAAKTMIDNGEKLNQLRKEIQDAMGESRPLAYRRWLGKILTYLDA